MLSRHKKSTSKEHKEFDRLIDFERPSSLGIKWRFFLAAVVLKNSSYNNSFFVISMLLIDLVMMVSPTFYPIFSVASVAHIERNPGEAIFPHSEFLSFLTPTILSTSSWMIVILVFFLISILCFIIALIYPHLAVFFRGILNLRIHMIFLPWITGTFGFCLYGVIARPDDLSTSFGMCVFFIVIYPFYLYMLSLLFFAEANSIIRPNSSAAEWFTHTPIWYPFEVAMISIVSYQSVNMPLPMMHICLFGMFVTTLLTAINAIITMPMILFISNEILATKMFIIATFLLFSQMSITYKVDFGMFALVLVPLYCLVVFAVVHFFSNKRRVSTQNLLSEIDIDVDQLSVEYLQETLTPTINQLSLIILVKEGLLSGNKAVLTDAFVQFCLISYPKSEWFLGFVTFLYAVIWSSHPNVYKFMLHLLSLDTFSAPTEFILFQYVYCFMQTSHHHSPIIARELTKYRQTLLKYVTAHRKFWLSAASRDLNEFTDSNTQMFRLFLSMLSQIRILKTMFPYCPAVRCELSLFEADLMHDTKEADKEYQKASSLLNPEEEFVTSTLFFGFSAFFPGARHLSIQKDTEISNYKFISFQDHYDDAKRHSTSLSINDTYITSLSHTFTMSRNQPQIDPNIDHLRLLLFYAFFAIASVGYILFMIGHHYINSSLDNINYKYLSIIKFMESTVDFRNSLNAVLYDIVLLKNILNTTYIDVGDNYEFFLYVLEHLYLDEMRMMDYKYRYETIVENYHDSFIDRNCNSTECTTTYMFGKIHEICLYFLHSNFENLSYILFDTKENVEITAYDLADGSTEVFGNIFKIYREERIKESSLITSWLAVLATLEIIFLVVSSAVFDNLTNKMKKNIFDIIRTAQPPIIQYIALQFDKLLAFDQLQQPNMKKASIPRLWIPTFLMYLFLIIYPMTIHVYLARFEHYNWDNSAFPQLIQITDSSQFLYLSLAYSELLSFNLFSSNEVMRDFVWSNHSCLHNLFNTGCENCSQYLDATKSINLNHMKVIHGFLLVFSFVCFLWFIYAGYMNIQYFKILKIFLKFIPNSAAQSNPIFSKLLCGQAVLTKDISAFSEDLKTNENEITFFAVLYIDNDGNITKTMGAAEKYLRKTFNNIIELKNHIIIMCPDYSKREIDAFFQLRPEHETLSISFEPGHEISLIFCKNPDSIVVKDDTHLFELNSRSRMAKKLISCLEDHIPTSFKNINKAIVINIEYNEQEELKQMCDQAGNGGFGFQLIDSRGNVALFVADAENEKECCQKCISFIETLSSANPELKIVANFCNPLTFLDSQKNQTNKSRCTGPGYDCARLLLIDAEVGKPIIPKSIYIGAEIDIEGMNFVDITISSELSISIRAD